MYQCHKCDKILSSSDRLNYHLLNNVCYKPSRTCPSCGKVFQSKRNCQYHMAQKVCGKPRAKLTLKLSQENLSRQELINKLTQTKEEILQMKGEIKALKENPRTVNNGDNNSNNNSNNNIILFPSQFGEEDIKYIKEKLPNLFEGLFKRPSQSIPKLFNKIHNSDKFPEYHNVYVASERSNYAMVSDGKTFTYKPKKTVIDQIIEDKGSLLGQYAEKNGDQLGDKVLKAYERYQNALDDDPQTRKDLEIEIGGLLLNMKSVIAQDEKTRQLLEQVDQGNFQLNDDDNN